MSKFGTKNVLFRYYWPKILKRLLSYFKSAPSNLYEFLTHKVNFGIGSTCSKGPGLGLGLLYKVCIFKQSSYFLQAALRLLRSCQLS